MRTFGRRFIGIGSLLASLAFAGTSQATLSTPTFIAFDATDCGVINLSWNTVPGATGYNIYRNGILVSVVGFDVTSYFDITMPGPGTYNYCIEAFDQTSVSGQACDGATLPVDPVTIAACDWYNDVFPPFTGPFGFDLFDHSGAVLGTGRNDASLTGNSSRQIQPGKKVQIYVTGSVNRVDMIFRIKPGPGNYCSEGHIVSGLNPSSSPNCTPPTSGFWYDLVTTPGDFATPGATALHNAATGGWDWNVWSSRRCKNPSAGLYTSDDFTSGNPILPDNLFTAGTHVEYYFRVEDGNSAVEYVPNPNCVNQVKGERTLSAHRWADFTVLPDRWKDGLWDLSVRDAAAPACMLVVDLDDGHGNERAWVSIADSIVATYQPRWGANSGWHALSRVGGSNNPVNLDDPASNLKPDNSVGFVTDHGGAPGTIWDLYRVRGARDHVNGNAGALGGRMGSVAAGFVAPGPSLDILRMFYRVIVVLTGDRTAQILGPITDRSQDDVGMLDGFLSGGSGTTLPRALMIFGSGFTACEDVAHPTFLHGTMGAKPRSVDYGTFTSFTPKTAWFGVVPAFNPGGDRYGVVNATPVNNEVIDLSTTSFGQSLAAQYLYYKPTPSSPAPPAAPYIAAIYGPSTLPSPAHPGVTYIDSRNINDLRELGGNGTTGRTAYFRELLVNFSSPLNCAPGPYPTLGVGNEPTIRSDYLRVRGNPTRGAVTFELGLGAETHARVAIYDLAGRMIRTLNDRVLEAGPHVLRWDGRDEQGVSTPPGIYMVRVRDLGHDIIAASKVVVLR
jgi:hypothetical protein